MNNLPLISFEKGDWANVAPFMFPILVSDGKRDELRTFLQEKNIETGISYIPIYKFSLFKQNENDYPSCEYIFSQIICLPIHPNLNDEDIKFICASIKDFFNA